MDIRQLGNHPTDNQNLEIARRRDRLQNQMDRFEETAVTFLGSGYDINDFIQVLGDSEDDYSDESNASAPPSIARHMDVQPETASIPLPSNIGLNRCRGLGLADLLKQEITLREGQANDALHAIRVNLADKAVIFRKTVRPAKSQARSTRAWSQVHAVERVVKLNARIYSKCRMQLGKLGADDILTKYRPLEKADLKASTAVADPNARGQRNSTLAWFWSLDVEGDSASSDWMTECESCLSVCGAGSFVKQFTGFIG